jgi:hypothetical protein
MQIVSGQRAPSEEAVARRFLTLYHQDISANKKQCHDATKRLAQKIQDLEVVPWAATTSLPEALRSAGDEVVPAASALPASRQIAEQARCAQVARTVSSCRQPLLLRKSLAPRPAHSKVNNLVRRLRAGCLHNL